MQNEGTRMFRVKAVAEMFDVSVHTIYRAIKAGELDALKVGGSIRIPEWSLRVYREACAAAAYSERVTGDGDPAAVDGAGQGGDVTVATVTPITARVQGAEAVR
ncbi:helix-turn-helix domain-containing protein [Actinosynnema sp. NPDC051121]